ncbi:MAG: MoaD/ThiS family protein [Planctomycetes bacterium]|nr:MoaD/ThiS family protein [Planctomycetota bacterium]
MAALEVQLPSLLASMVEEGSVFSMQAETLAEAFRSISENHPKLALHLFDESGGLRRHVLCFHNDANTRWLETLDVPIRSGDSLLFMQAVSGG